MSGTYLIGAAPITLQDVHSVAVGGRPVELSVEARERVAASRASVERIIVSQRPVYGVTTGFGKLASVAIGADEHDLLQRNLLLSHAVGVGPHLPVSVVRAAMLLRCVSLSRGHSGIRPETLDLLVELLNRNVTPVVPAQGSVGSSGDLAPLAHIAIVLMGQGMATVGGERAMPALLALRTCGLEPVSLGAKEGLALINGTQVMTAIAALAVYRAQALAKTADIAGAMTLEAVHGTASPFDARVHEVRAHRGQGLSAANIRSLIDGSGLVDSEADRLQDAYSIRCMPVVHGAARDAIAHVASVLDIEMNAVTDNPLIFADADDVISGGNFHGEPVALAADYLGIAACEIGNISERRTFRLLDGSYRHLPPFLVEGAGLNSGLMITQYTAAALVSENKGLAFPNSADSVPTSANQEDHNSMGTIAARNAAQIIENVEQVCGIELFNAAQALEFSRDAKPGAGVSAACQAVRDVIKPWEADRYINPDMQACAALVRSGEFLDRVEAACGALN